MRIHALLNWTSKITKYNLHLRAAQPRTHSVYVCVVKLTRSRITAVTLHSLKVVGNLKSKMAALKTFSTRILVCAYDSNDSPTAITICYHIGYPYMFEMSSNTKELHRE